MTWSPPPFPPKKMESCRMCNINLRVYTTFLRYWKQLSGTEINPFPVRNFCHENIVGLVCLLHIFICTQITFTLLTLYLLVLSADNQMQTVWTQFKLSLITWLWWYSWKNFSKKKISRRQKSIKNYLGGKELSYPDQTATESDLDQDCLQYICY